MKTGSHVLIMDRTHSTAIVDNRIAYFNGSNQTPDEAIVIKSGELKLPADKHATVINDTIIRRLCDNTIIFISSKQLALIKEPC